MQILTTKLYIPSPRSIMVLRPRLIEKLNKGLHRKLTLVSAPAGFGKTTLVAEWITADDRPAAWLSLDERDSDLVHFLMYAVAALQTIVPQIGMGINNLLQSPQPPPIESLLTPLLNDITTIPHDFLFVLDDYHVLDSQEINAAMTFLIENMPPQMHLVITTREDPPLPLARLRARGQLAEIRAADLRFTPDEAAEFLNHALGLNLSLQDVAALEARTEGWIVGLQLAALSLQSQPNTADFIESFTGSHHFVLDYLVEEVLNRQPEHIQNFLLCTSILDRMCGPLCDAILQSERPSSQQILESIQQANLFLVPLDNERHWYRYHHLFGGLLRKRLQQSAHIDINALHSRASTWYETSGFELEAFHHAAMAGDIERAEQLIEGDSAPLYLRGSALPVIKWLASLPGATLDANPSLAVTYATVLTVSGQQIDRVESRLQAAEIALRAAPADDKHRDLRGRIAAIRGMLAGPRYDLETMLSQSSQALELLHADNKSMRLLALWTNGLAHQHLGDTDAARQVYIETLSTSQITHNTMVTVAALTCLGQIDEAVNELDRAQQSYDRVLDLVGDPPWPAACEAYLGLARIHYQRGELDHAEQYSRQGMELGKQIENVDTPVDSGIMLARVQMARGNLEGAEITLTECEQLIQQRAITHKLPELREEQARLQLQRDGRQQTIAYTQPLVEPLSERELEVLRLVADGLSNHEISERLYLALDTIKGHNRRIYAKLGVQRRTEAVARANELGLL